MPTVAEMIATVAIITQVAKTFLASPKVNIKLTKVGKVVLAGLASVGVVGYHWGTSGDPFAFTVIMTLVEVFIGATAGYAILRKAGMPK